MVLELRHIWQFLHSWILLGMTQEPLHTDLEIFCHSCLQILLRSVSFDADGQCSFLGLSRDISLSSQQGCRWTT